MIKIKKGKIKNHLEKNSNDLHLYFSAKKINRSAIFADRKQLNAENFFLKKIRNNDTAQLLNKQTKRLITSYNLIATSKNSKILQKTVLKKLFNMQFLAIYLTKIQIKNTIFTKSRAAALKKDNFYSLNYIYNYSFVPTNIYQVLYFWNARELLHNNNT